MGLRERRVQKDFVENNYPQLAAEVQQAAGFPVEIEVDWKSLCEPEREHLYVEAWPKVYFKPLAEALSAISADEMGAEALQESLSKIVIQNQRDNSNGHYWAEFNEGVLTLDHKPMTNTEQVTNRTNSVRTLLENSL